MSLEDIMNNMRKEACILFFRLCFLFFDDRLLAFTFLWFFFFFF